MKNCPYCGALNPDDSIFCSKCGNSVSIPAQPQAYQPQNTGGYAQPPLPPPAPYAAPYATQPYAAQKPGDPGKNWMSILSMILGILAVLVCCIPYIPLFFGLGGIVFGILGMKSQQKGMSIAGIITGGVGLIIGGFYLVGILFAAASPEWFEGMMSEFEQYLPNLTLFFHR